VFDGDLELERRAEEGEARDQVPALRPSADQGRIWRMAVHGIKAVPGVGLVRRSLDFGGERPRGDAAAKLHDGARKDGLLPAVLGRFTFGHGNKAAPAPVVPAAPRRPPVSQSDVTNDVASGTCRTRRCYIIPEEEDSFSAGKGRVGSFTRGSGGAGVAQSAVENGVLPPRVHCRWHCPLTARLEDLPANATVAGNVISIGAAPNMRGCRLSQMCNSLSANAASPNTLSGNTIGGRLPTLSGSVGANGIV